MTLWLDFLDFLLGLAFGVAIVAGLQLIRYRSWLRRNRL